MAVVKTERLAYVDPELKSFRAYRYSNMDTACVVFSEIERPMTRAEVQAALNLFDAILSDWPEA